MNGRSVELTQCRECGMCHDRDACPGCGGGDRELLKLAAKAAGLILHPPGDVRADGAMLIDLGSDAPGKWWNPIHDDGDALRLAVKLNIDLSFRSYPEGIKGFEAGDFVVAMNGYGCKERINAGDNGAATRRAIFRAAAEIGRAMP